MIPQKTPPLDVSISNSVKELLKSFLEWQPTIFIRLFGLVAERRTYALISLFSVFYFSIASGFTSYFLLTLPSLYESKFI